jgi:hypothetical protein
MYRRITNKEVSGSNFDNGTGHPECLLSPSVSPNKQATGTFHSHSSQFIYNTRHLIAHYVCIWQSVFTQVTSAGRGLTAPGYRSREHGAFQKCFNKRSMLRNFVLLFSKTAGNSCMDCILNRFKPLNNHLTQEYTSRWHVRGALPT